MTTYTYEESVHWLRNQPEYADLVTSCYLDQDNEVAARRFAQSEEFLAVVKLLNLDQSSETPKILDLGCGSGIASYAFASIGQHIVAIDPGTSDDVGLGATKRLAAIVSDGSIKTFQACAESLPFADESFDIVYARQALHHFSDLEKGLVECARVLKPKGRLLATREHVISDQDQLKAFLDHHILHKLHGGEYAYPVIDYVSALETAGLTVAQCLAPFETVINHAPITNQDIENGLFKTLEKRVGTPIASYLANLNWVESFYRGHLSRSCNDPGRLYSFLCVK